MSRCALFGYGYWGQKIYPLLNQSGVEVVVIDPEQEKNKKNKDITWSNLDSVIQDADCTHCYVVIPEEYHYDVVKKCLQAGKHVWVEKPLCLTRQQAEELLALAQQQQKLVFIDRTFLYDEAAKQLSVKLKQKVIGEIQDILSIRASVGTAAKGVDITDDVVPHDIYLMKYLFEAVLTQPVIQEAKFENGIAKKVNFSAQLSSGTTVKNFLAQYSYLEKTPERKMIINGTNGRLVWEKRDNQSILSTYAVESEKTYRVVSEEKIHQVVSPLELALLDFTQQTKALVEDTYHFTLSIYQEYVNEVTTLEQLRNELHQFYEKNSTS